jgi:Fur family peroxide stress response transcriptional regulator
MTIKDDGVFIARFKHKCRANNLKITPQRTAIYRELIKSKDHPSASTIFNKLRKIFPDISFDTVNRTLLTFNEIGIASLVEGYGEPKRFDPDTKSHHHFRCIKCNDIMDIHHRSFDNIKIPEEIKRQFTVLNKRVVIEGICGKCIRKSNSVKSHKNTSKPVS